MTPHSTDRVVKRGSFLYDGSAPCHIEIIQTDFRPGCEDDEEPIEDAYGEFYEIRYHWPGQPACAASGYCDSLAEAMASVEKIVKQVTWEQG